MPSRTRTVIRIPGNFDFISLIIGAKNNSSVRSPESTINTRDSSPISPGSENACERTILPRIGVTSPTIILSFLVATEVALKNLSPWLNPLDSCKLGAN